MNSYFTFAKYFRRMSSNTERITPDNLFASDIILVQSPSPRFGCMRRADAYVATTSDTHKQYNRKIVSLANSVWLSSGNMLPIELNM